MISCLLLPFYSKTSKTSALNTNSLVVSPLRVSKLPAFVVGFAGTEKGLRSRPESREGEIFRGWNHFLLWKTLSHSVLVLFLHIYLHKVFFESVVVVIVIFLISMVACSLAGRMLLSPKDFRVNIWKTLGDFPKENRKIRKGLRNRWLGAWGTSLPNGDLASAVQRWGLRPVHKWLSVSSLHGQRRKNEEQRQQMQLWSKQMVFLEDFPKVSVYMF